ncbi:NAD(P)-dependent dehydrogenase, short-chain alcohol dehydrogenase family [Alteribacillus persepolensis]|uniref:NAD(P)-dependent dehydrogenase, short-chain alcohol dehydrogenase family n=1 Tax=Alteribacillus persepolensis TaxID=568899 RepID=A0A1G8K3Z9_9BACI|nr:SDR family oxidoreductase [Alteribacillus persepolensis]SDI38097.1 NAD(P)-dependent dehydrogenase, short-chain alcohol dehydrogenase family [Alteribacillus persepolensis]
MSNDMNKRLEGKVAIITGAGSGIGRATAKRFADQGASLVLNDIDRDRLNNLLQELIHQDNHLLIDGDISKEETANSLSDAAIEKHGQIDILVNNAGIHFIKDITDVTPDDFDRCVSINMKSMYLCARAVIPHMLERKQGSIINLGSISSFVGQEMMGKSTFLYNMTKAAAVQMAKSLATRYAADGIRVNAVCPGATKTDQITEEHTQNIVTMEEFWKGAGESHPVQRPADPSEIANAILFLASDESSFVTGSPLVVDGGYTAQ